MRSVNAHVEACSMIPLGGTARDESARRIGTVQRALALERSEAVAALAIAMVKVCVAVSPAESVSVPVNENVPAVVGVPMSCHVGPGDEGVCMTMPGGKLLTESE